jgi:hypothetical protein
MTSSGPVDRIAEFAGIIMQPGRGVAKTRRDWPVVHLFREEGQSAKTTRREQFHLMLPDFDCSDVRNARFTQTALDQVCGQIQALRLLDNPLEATSPCSIGRSLEYPSISRSGIGAQRASEV